VIFVWFSKANPFLPELQYRSSPKTSKIRRLWLGAAAGSATADAAGSCGYIVSNLYLCRLYKLRSTSKQ